jgi:4-hydroxy-tetrahydrodipicolinate reductase
MTKTRIAINGAAGRMGQRLIALASADPDLEVVAALEFAEHPDIGKDVGLVAGAGEIGVPLSTALEVEANAAIDFSLPAGAEAIVRICAERGVPLVMATTGLDDEQKQLITSTAEKVPVVWAPNMSLAVNLTMKLAATAAEVLKGNPNGADVEIIERHHRFKKDAPSGTALRFGEIIANVMGQTEHVHGRHGLVGQRPRDEVGYHALRVGDNPGEHTIVFGMLGETIELTVRATNRDCYALGALAAAKFVSKQSPGLYGMNDVLGL